MILLTLLFPILDRLRGTKSYFIWPYAIAVGLVYQSYGVAIGFVAGESFGWGAVISSVLSGEKSQGYNINASWQTLAMGKYPRFSAIIRGALWGIFPALLGLYETTNALWLLPIMTISFPAALLISKAVGGPLKQKWERQEYIRGAIVALLTVAVLL